MAYEPISNPSWVERDSLPDGASAKVIKGVDFGTEFDNIKAEFDDVSADLTQAKADIADLQSNGGGGSGGSDPALEGRVANLETRVDALEAAPERIKASVFYKDQEVKTSHNILMGGVIKSPDNELATRVVFANPLGGDTPDHYSFSVTALSDSNPMLCTVLKIDNNFVDFSTLLWDGSNWTYAVGGVVNFSLTVFDMDG